MRTVWVELGEGAYPVEIGHGLLGRAGELLGPHLTGSKLLLVSDSQVAPLYMERAAAGLAGERCIVEPLVVPAGEGSKNLANFGLLLEALAARRFERGDAVVALGGGMISDLAGFAAASYHRGIAFAILPTTLLAMADASIGGKVAINLSQGKNLAGAFHQPKAVIADLETLRTLSTAQLIEGLAEIVKIGILYDAELFASIERDQASLLIPKLELFPAVVARAVELKARVVARDEREAGARVLLNLGHTFAHGLEAAGGYRRPTHGEAVLLGLIAAARLARNLDLLAERDQSRIELLAASLVHRCRPPAIDLERAAQAMLFDKKTAGGKLRFVLPRAIGRAEIRSDVPRSLASEALHSLQSLWS